MNKAKVNLANAKRSGNTNEAQKQADLVQSWAEKVGDRVDKAKTAEEGAKNASTVWQNAQNQTNAFESFYKSFTIAAQAQKTLTDNLLKEQSAIKEKKAAEEKEKEKCATLRILLQGRLTLKHTEEEATVYSFGLLLFAVCILIVVACSSLFAVCCLLLVL